MFNEPPLHVGVSVCQESQKSCDRSATVTSDKEKLNPAKSKSRSAHTTTSNRGNKSKNKKTPSEENTESVS